MDRPGTDKYKPKAVTRTVRLSPETKGYRCVFDVEPRESEKLSWIYVGLGVVLVYATIPLARALREAVDAQVGRAVFLYIAAVVIVLVAILALNNLRRRGLPASAYLWLLAVVAVFAFNI